MEQSRQQTIRGVTIILLAVIAWVAVGVLIFVKGVGSSLSAITGGIFFTVILALFWFRSKRGDVNAADSGQ